MANTSRTKEVQFNMAVSAATDMGMSEDDALLAALMGDAELASLEAEESFEESDEASFDGLDESDFADEEKDEAPAFEAAVAEIERAEAIQAVYDELTEEDAAVIEAAPVKAAKVAKVKAVKEPKEPKEPAPPRITYVGHSTSEVLVAKLGEKASELLMLEVADVTLSTDDLKAKQDALLVSIDALAKKVGEKSVMLFGWLDKGGKLNDVMSRAFTVLARDGELVMGQKGNLHLNLLEKFSVGTANSQGNQMAMLFPFLKIVTRNKGVMVVNQNSLIFMKMKAELGLA